MEKAFQYRLARTTKKQFLDENGDCNAMRQMSEAAQIFDTLFLCTLSTADIVTVLHHLTEKLTVFEYRHFFTPTILKSLQKEQPAVVGSKRSKEGP